MTCEHCGFKCQATECECTCHNAMCKCGRERIASGYSVRMVSPSADISWGICNLCGQELENGTYPAVPKKVMK